MESRRIVIIPVYHEIGLIGKVIKKFDERYVDQICIVLDCPSRKILDEIKESAERIFTPIKIIKNSGRKGIGYAIKQGVAYALREKYDIIVVMSGSNKDNPKEIPKLLYKIINEDYDYVQGSRFLPGGRCGNIPLARRLLVRFYPIIWTIITGVRCTDVTNGFRAYKTEIFEDKSIDIGQKWLNDYSLEFYIHYKVLMSHYKTTEVPVSRVYPSEIRGSYSKISPLRDFWSIVRPLFYLTFGLRR